MRVRARSLVRAIPVRPCASIGAIGVYMPMYHQTGGVAQKEDAWPPQNTAGPPPGDWPS
ncbi:hypothetical protein STVIR_5647 [Streptomyces viridochromogenes Tue57]|uniref:Uncharacterized protein n=1 Tax=Streptomyces viridochromogenes Tue57 TaxID=1160705 RepID=L8PB83_STRVR|nr:hypothetical protein STVIR_5647 [Streptomyces viridochromogenes Tue57]